MSDKWIFFAFRPSFDPIEDIVGGSQVRPFELFRVYAEAGHTVVIWETDGSEGPEERRYFNDRLIVKKLKYSGAFSLPFQLLEMRKCLRVAVRQAKEDGFTKLCYYNQIPVSVVFRLGLVPVISQPGILLFDYALSLGLVTWGNVHDISPDHELSARERVSSQIQIRNVNLKAYFHELIQRVFLKKSTFVSAGSVGMREALLERYPLSADQVYSMQAGYNQELLSTLAEWEPPESGSPWTIGYLGSFMDASLEILVEAFSRLEGKELRLLLAGRGMNQAVSTYGSSLDNIEVIEDARYSNFAEIASEVDIWAVPLLDTFVVDFCWQLKMPMYLASGRPIVRTNGKALADSGLSEFVFATKATPENFAVAIEEILSEPETALQRARQGRAEIQASATWEKVAMDLLDGLEKVSA